MTDPHADDGPDVPLLDEMRVPGRTPHRIGGSLTVSLGAHMAVFLFLAFILGGSKQSSQAEIKPEIPSHIIWIVQPGAGGGGSGDATPNPPRLLRRVGHDAVALPPTQSFASRRTEDVVPAERPLDIPAVPTTAGLREQIGVVTQLTIVTADAHGPGRGGNAGTRNGSGDGAGLGPGLESGRNGGGPGGDRGGSGVSPPVLIHEVKPGYTADAMRARIQGTVGLQAIVQPDGSIGDTHIIRSLDSTFGLDQEAERTIRQWRFAPATQAGRAVAVLIDVELTFTLR